MRLSNILIGISLMILVSTGFLLFLTNGVTKYNPAVPANYNDSFIKIQANLDELASISNETNDKLVDVKSDGNIVTDFLGFFFGKGYQAVQTLINGVKLNVVILDASVDNGLEATGFGGTIKAVGLLLISIFIILMLLAFIIKSEWI